MTPFSDDFFVHEFDAGPLHWEFRKKFNHKSLRFDESHYTSETQGVALGCYRNRTDVIGTAPMLSGPFGCYRARSDVIRACSDVIGTDDLLQ